MDQPPPIPPAPLKKKGLPAAAWVGIGCLGVVIVGVLIAGIGGVFLFKKVSSMVENPEKMAAEMVVRANPDLEILSSDETKGELTLRTRVGQEMTLSYADIAQGKLEMMDAEGNKVQLGSADLSQIPAWVPMAPDFMDGFSMFSSASGREVSGQFSGKSGMTADDLRSFFLDEASSLGLMSSRSKTTAAGGVTVSSLSFSGGGKSFSVVITGKRGDPTLVTSTYSETK